MGLRLYPTSPTPDPSSADSSKEGSGDPDWRRNRLTNPARDAAGGRDEAGMAARDFGAEILVLDKNHSGFDGPYHYLFAFEALEKRVWRFQHYKAIFDDLSHWPRLFISQRAGDYFQVKLVDDDKRIRLRKTYTSPRAHTCVDIFDKIIMQYRDSVAARRLGISVHVTFANNYEFVTCVLDRWGQEGLFDQGHIQASFSKLLKFREEGVPQRAS
ncbi:hypothetical protein QBC46DRAFT_419180 [Diplogelasinospora grovesii]|uniref:Uncharacterized protein n=1 Tax=Diplogelasinospora grovesii TaxID=303347 RepID=A0AAN6N0P9_9PEZI|nr:hypothetical protein QBC46DRAFT_419180 [Diplogelasinospora grovesii]